MVKMAHVWRDRIYIQLDYTRDQMVVKRRNDSWQPAFWRSSLEPADCEVIDLDADTLILRCEGQLSKLAVRAIQDPDRPNYLCVAVAENSRSVGSVWDLLVR